MTDVLLQKLKNSDLDWLLATGIKIEIPASTVLFHQGQFVNSLYILLDGALIIREQQM